MATINGYTKEHMLEIENGVIESAAIVGGHLIFTKHDGSHLDVGMVQGDTGPTGATGPPGTTPNPSGMIAPYAGVAAPTGYLICDGSAVSRTVYPNLFATIGTRYGVGDGSMTFNIPNLIGRAIVGLDGTQTEFDTLGKTGGAKTVTLDATMIPAHTHAVGSLATANAGGHAHSYSGAFIPNAFSTGGQTVSGGNVAFGSTSTSVDGDHTHGITGATASIGGSGAHQNMPPFVVLNYIIKT